MESMHQYVLDQLKAAKDWDVVAAGSGVSVRTIEKIASREIEYPRVDKVERLVKYFRTKKQRPS